MVPFYAQVARRADLSSVTILAATIEGPARCPASYLRKHPNASVLADESTASLLYA